MKKTLHFCYKSIGNMVRLMTELHFEKTKSARDITVFHQRFENEPDETFEKFLETLYPEGGTIGVNEINHLTDYIYDFMRKDDLARDFYAAYDKRHYDSYVYFKPDKIVLYTNIGCHEDIVIRFCCNYFKDFAPDEIKPDYLQKFILENFEIKSDFTTVEAISHDADYIAYEIISSRKEPDY